MSTAPQAPRTRLPRGATYLSIDGIASGKASHFPAAHSLHNADHIPAQDQGKGVNRSQALRAAVLDQQVRILKYSLEISQEACPCSPVHNAMVCRQGELHLGSQFDLAIDVAWRIHDLADGQDG